MASKASPATGARRSPRSTRTRTPARRAFSFAARTARRETSTAVVSWPSRAAASASTPLPVPRSSTRRPGGSASAASASASRYASDGGGRTPGGTNSRTPALLPPPAASGNVTLRSVFDLPAPLTVGLEEELMLLDGETLDLAPRAPDVMDAVGDDPRFKPELPLAQLEIVTPPAASVPEAMAAVAGARRDLAAAAANRGLRLGGAGVHPFAAPAGELNPAERYERTRSEYAWVARRQLVFGFQIHVAVRPADRALAVYNALRSYLPELAALAANAPWYAGEDTGLASVRPKLSETLPRQGVPPAVASWEELEAGLAWGMASGTVPEPRIWWWELRLHPTYGTLEIRVPDTQATVADSSGIAAVAHALVHHLAARADAADLPPAAPTWRIEENRWAA